MEKKVIEIASLEALPEAARQFVEAMDDFTVFAFYGEMGAGKTTFINGQLLAVLSALRTM